MIGCHLPLSLKLHTTVQDVTVAEICFPSLPTEQKSEPKQYIEWTKMQYSVQNARKQQPKKHISEIPTTTMQISVFLISTEFQDTGL